MSLENLIRRIKKEFKNGNINRQQFKTIKGQCLAGDVDGALKGLKRITK